MLNFFKISLPETRRDFASSRSAGELIFTWVASDVELAREQCPGAADRVGHQVWGGVPVQEEGGSEGGVWHNGVARHWQCGSLCQLTTTVAPPEGSRLLRLAVGPRQPASSEDQIFSDLPHFVINFPGIFRSPSWNVHVWDLLPIDLDQLNEWNKRPGFPCVCLVLRCKYTYKCRDQMRKVKMWQIWTRKNYCSWQRKLKHICQGGMLKCNILHINISYWGALGSY